VTSVFPLALFRALSERPEALLLCIDLASTSKPEKVHDEKRIKRAAATVTSKAVAELIIDELHEIEKDEEEKAKKGQPAP
jgi:hypothetical protein